MLDQDEEATLPDEHIVATEEAPAESPTAKPEQTQSSDGDNSQDELPAHLQPAWIAREKRFTEQLEKAIGETKSEYEKRMADLEERLPKEAVATSPFLKKLVGEDPELAKDWEAEKESIRQQTIEAYEAKQQEIAQAREAESKRWLNWVDSSIKNLRDSGKEFDDNELKAIAVKYKPTDELGNIDFNLAYELLLERKAKEQEKQEEKSTARKKIASETTTVTKGETPKRDYMTRRDFR
jgi:hypothetical protein